MDLWFELHYIASVKLETAAHMLDKMGNPTRLRIVRLLVRAGMEGLSVGQIQKKLGTPGSTLTHHLSNLKSAGLITQERQQATLCCKVSYERINELVQYLTKECCADSVKSH